MKNFLINCLFFVFFYLYPLQKRSNRIILNVRYQVEKLSLNIKGFYYAV